MATHSSVLAWRIPGTAEPGGVLSMGLHRVRHDWSDLAAAANAGMAIHFSILAWRLPVDRGAWQATDHRLAKSQTRLKWLSTHINAEDTGEEGLKRFPWRRKWQTSLVFLQGKSRGQRRPADYCPWGHKESDISEQPSKGMPSEKGCGGLD